MAVDFVMDGPIPGENFTSDTRNYPWHRPPQFTTTDEAIEYISKMLMREQAMASSIFMMEMGLDIATMTDIFITKGISEGKWSVDLGLLLAGPVAHVFVILARGYDLPVNLGLTKDFSVPTPVFFNAMKKEMKKLNKEKNKGIKEEVEESVVAPSMGFMAGIDSGEGENGEVEPNAAGGDMESFASADRTAGETADLDTEPMPVEEEVPVEGEEIPVEEEQGAVA